MTILGGLKSGANLFLGTWGNDLSKNLATGLRDDAGLKTIAKEDKIFPQYKKLFEKNTWSNAKYNVSQIGSDIKQARTAAKDARGLLSDDDLLKHPIKNLFMHPIQSIKDALSSDDKNILKHPIDSIRDALEQDGIKLTEHPLQGLKTIAETALSPLKSIAKRIAKPITDVTENSNISLIKDPFGTIKSAYEEANLPKTAEDIVEDVTKDKGFFGNLLEKVTTKLPFLGKATEALKKVPLLGAVMQGIGEVPKVWKAFTQGGPVEGVKQLFRSGVNVAVQSLGFTAGEALGGIIGQVLCPIPGLGILLGLGVSAVAGNVVDHFLGKDPCEKLADDKSNNTASTNSKLALNTAATTTSPSFGSTPYNYNASGYGDNSSYGKFLFNSATYNGIASDLAEVYATTNQRTNDLIMSTSTPISSTASNTTNSTGSYTTNPWATNSSYNSGINTTNDNTASDSTADSKSDTENTDAKCKTKLNYNF